MDSDLCDDSNSVTSPAAYFVEILQFLRNNNLDSIHDQSQSSKSKPATPLRQNVLQKFFDRRPDLGNLQLTCPNTNSVLPCIGLANEVMESFVVHLNEENPGDAK